MKWTLLHKLNCPVDVPLVIHNLDTCMSRKNVSNSLLDVLACSIAVSFFSLFVFPPPTPPPPRAPQNAAQLLNILSKTIFQNHLIRYICFKFGQYCWNNNIRNNDNNEDNMIMVFIIRKTYVMSAINNTTHWSTPQNVVYTIFQWQIDY